MVLKLEGKQHRKGVSSKTGRDYDFTVVHVLMSLSYVEGKAAVTKNIGSDVIAFDRLLVGQYYDFQTDFNGNITAVVPAKA